MSTFFGWLNPKRKIKKLIEKSVREGRRGNHAEAERLRDAAQCLEDYLAAEAASPRNATPTFVIADFKSKAIELVKEAVAEDNTHNYEKALQLYLPALDYFSEHLKYEKNPASKARITEKARARRARRRPLPSRELSHKVPCLLSRQFTEYLARAEELQRCEALRAAAVRHRR